MPFPSQVSHRRNRRKLGRGQYPARPAITAAATSTGTTNFTLTFDRPVNIAGTIGTTVTGLTLVSQTVTSPTTVSQTWSGNVATKDYTIPANDPNVSDAYGGRLAGSAGTFP